MPMNIEEITEAILTALPNLPEHTLSSILEKLASIGVEHKSDLSLVKEEDLQDHLRPIQCRKLLQAWSTEDQMRGAAVVQPVSCDASSVGMSWSSCHQNSSSSSTTPSQAGTSSTVDLDTWPDSFKVPWSKMPAGIKAAIAMEQRPNPRDRRQMVRIVVDEMRLTDANPSRSDCQSVAKMIVKQYPKSFADILKDGTKLGSGYASLVNQLKTRVEHLNRDNFVARRRREKRLSSLSSNTSTRQRGPSDQYGCIRWQPDCPLGETESSLEEKQKEMIDLYSHEGSAGAEREHLTQLMQTTYYLQRKAINANPAPSIMELKSSWPYLFTLKELYNHFKLLTDISILEKMEAAIEEKGTMILQFFQKKPTNEEVKQVLSKFDATGSTLLGPCVILLVMAHFKEKVDALILQVDATATPADVEGSMSLPDSPRLIVQGETLSSMKWMISIEGQVVISPHPNFVAGLAAAFASFYTFNFEYQEEASCTLEFIQRCFVGINPSTGSKTTVRKALSKTSGQMVQKKKQAMNANVCSLLRRLMDFDWLCV